MNHASPTQQDVPVDSLFEIAMRGYNKKQVEEYLAWLQDQAQTVQSELSGAQNDLTAVRRELALTREDLVESRRQLANRPAHEEVSERLGQILRLADEEADQKRDEAAARAEEAVADAKREALRVLEAAHAEADNFLSNAREQGDGILASARTEAEHLVAATTADARARLADATERAEHQLGDADRRTTQITALQNERLARLLEVHADSVERLDAVRGILADLLHQELSSGDPAAYIDDAPLPIIGGALTDEKAAPEPSFAVVDVDQVHPADVTDLTAPAPVNDMFRSPDLDSPVEISLDDSGPISTRR